MVQLCLGKHGKHNPNKIDSIHYQKTRWRQHHQDINLFQTCLIVCDHIKQRQRIKGHKIGIKKLYDFHQCLYKPLPLVLLNFSAPLKYACRED